MASSLKKMTGILALIILVIAVFIPSAAAAGGGGGSLRRQSQPAAQPSNNAAVAAVAPLPARRKLEDEGYADEWAEEYYEEEAEEAEAAEEGGYEVWFDDDKFKEYEIEAQENFWSMFNSAPATWTPGQWGFFAGIMTLFMIIFCCIFRVICPCCSRG